MFHWLGIQDHTIKRYCQTTVFWTTLCQTNDSQFCCTCIVQKIRKVFYDPETKSSENEETTKETENTLETLDNNLIQNNSIEEENSEKLLLENENVCWKKSVLGN